MNELYERIYAAVMTIPRGRVATYAQVAAMVGNPRLCHVRAAGLPVCFRAVVDGFFRADHLCKDR